MSATARAHRLLGIVRLDVALDLAAEVPDRLTERLDALGLLLVPVGDLTLRVRVDSVALVRLDLLLVLGRDLLRRASRDGGTAQVNREAPEQLTVLVPLDSLREDRIHPIAAEAADEDAGLVAVVEVELHRVAGHALDRLVGQLGVLAALPVLHVRRVDDEERPGVHAGLADLLHGLEAGHDGAGELVHRQHVRSGRIPRRFRRVARNRTCALRGRRVGPALPERRDERDVAPASRGEDDLQLGLGVHPFELLAAFEALPHALVGRVLLRLPLAHLLA